MYPLAPVSRMSDVFGVAAGFVVNMFDAKVSALFISDLSPRLGPLEWDGDATLRPSFHYFFFMLFLIRSRVARYSLLPGSDANAFSMEAIASACFSTPIATKA